MNAAFISILKREFELKEGQFNVLFFKLKDFDDEYGEKYKHYSVFIEEIEKKEKEIKDDSIEEIKKYSIVLIHQVELNRELEILNNKKNCVIKLEYNEKTKRYIC